jgi:hypothetical protein
MDIGGQWLHVRRAAGSLQIMSVSAHCFAVIFQARAVWSAIHFAQ